MFEHPDLTNLKLSDAFLNPRYILANIIRHRLLSRMEDAQADCVSPSLSYIEDAAPNAEEAAIVEIPWPDWQGYQCHYM